MDVLHYWVRAGSEGGKRGRSVHLIRQDIAQVKVRSTNWKLKVVEVEPVINPEEGGPQGSSGSLVSAWSRTGKELEEVVLSSL